MAVCGLNGCLASARPQSFVVRADLAADPNSLSRDCPGSGGRMFVRVRVRARAAKPNQGCSARFAW
jgi:hypothetical protein